MDFDALKPKERFSDLVEDYSMYRPGYPDEILDVLVDRYDLRPSSIVADIGSGTGKLSRLFLSNGNTVYAVEPNDRMRARGEELFKGDPHFISINGQAENTTLAAHSVDLIVCGTAFHWFAKIQAKSEFERIAKPGGTVMLVWNRRDNTIEMMQHYDAILSRFCPDYKQVGRELFSKEDIMGFFAPQNVAEYDFNNSQVFDFEGLLGRIRSTSYCPHKDSNEYALLVPELRTLFERYKNNGLVRFKYFSVMFVARYPV